MSGSGGGLRQAGIKLGKNCCITIVCYDEDDEHDFFIWTNGSLLTAGYVIVEGHDQAEENGPSEVVTAQ